MIKLVSEQLSIKLKELGYDVPTAAYYSILGEENEPPVITNIENHNSVDHVYSAPSFEEVIDWLDSKGLYVSTGIQSDGEWHYIICVDFNCFSIKTTPMEKHSGFKDRGEAKQKGVESAVKYLLGKIGIYENSSV